ncbi:hypothetical protein D9M71_759750 [compost metagenome]
MFDIPAEESIGVELFDDGRIVDEVPVGQYDYLEVTDATVAQFSQGKVYALDNEHRVFEVTVHHHQFAGTMACKFADDVLHGTGQRGAIEAGGSRKMVAAA